MPPRSKVEHLPEPIFEELKKRLVDSAFSDYRGHAEWLATQGYEIRKSAVHQFGQGFEAELERMRLSVAEAKEVVKAVPDSENAMNDALMRMVQHRVYELLRDAEVADLPPKALAALTRAIADVGRASIAQKKWESEIREKGAGVIDEMAKAAGMNSEQAAHWRTKFLAIPEAKGA
jgi:hypothetical protein